MAVHRLDRMFRPESMVLIGASRHEGSVGTLVARNLLHAGFEGPIMPLHPRHEAIEGWPGKTAVAAQLWEVAERNTPHTDVAAYTQAMMDLGATLCTRSKPRCEACPLSEDCQARREDTIASYPGRKPKTVRPLKTTMMVLAVHDGAVYLERRPPAGIWGVVAGDFLLDSEAAEGTWTLTWKSGKDRGVAPGRRAGGPCRSGTTPPDPGSGKRRGGRSAGRSTPVPGRGAVRSRAAPVRPGCRGGSGRRILDSAR